MHAFKININSSCYFKQSQVGETPSMFTHFAELRTLSLRSWRIHVRSKLTLTQKNKNKKSQSFPVAELSCGFCNRRWSATFPNQNKVRINLQPNTSNFLTEKTSPPEPALCFLQVVKKFVLQARFNVFQMLDYPSSVPV